jgi:hypothetical protein
LLSYHGRSIQFFRVFTGHFDTEISKGDPGQIATFAHTLITHLRAYGDSVAQPIDVLCGIQSAITKGLRFRCRRRENDPLVFEFYDSPVLISTLVAEHGAPNVVNVSRDYRENIFGRMTMISNIIIFVKRMAAISSIRITVRIFKHVKKLSEY